MAIKHACSAKHYSLVAPLILRYEMSKLKATLDAYLLLNDLWEVALLFPNKEYEKSN